MQQQLPAAQRLVFGIPAMAVRADVHVVDEHLAVFDAGKAVAEVDAALADRLHLGAEQHDTGLERLEEVIVVPRLAVLGDVRLGFLPLGFRGHWMTQSSQRYARSRDSFAASNTAAIILSGSATPWPAMSNAVP